MLLPSESTTELNEEILALIHGLAQEPESIWDRTSASAKTEQKIAEPVKKRRLGTRALTSSLYIIQIEISIGACRTKFQLEHLGLSGELIDELTALKISSPSIPLYEELQLLRNRLNGLRNALHNKYMFRADPVWLCYESDLPKIINEFREMENVLQESKKNILQDYVNSKYRFLTSIAKVLLFAKIPLDKVHVILDYYSKKFPSRTLIKSELYVFFRAPQKILSLQDEVLDMSTTQLAKAQVSQTKMLEAVTEGYRDCLERGLQWCREEAYTALHESFEEMVKREGEVLNVKSKNKLNTLCTRLKRLAGFSPELQELSLLLSETVTLRYETNDFLPQLKAVKSKLYPLLYGDGPNYDRLCSLLTKL